MGEERGFKKLSMSCGDNYYGKKQSRKRGETVSAWVQVVDQFSQHHLLKRLSLMHCIFLPPLSKIRCPYVRGFISGLSILFH